jgi:hypothetical protein
MGSKESKDVYKLVLVVSQIFFADIDTVARLTIKLFLGY